MVDFSMNYAPVETALDEMASTHIAIRNALDTVGSTQATYLNVDTWTGHAPDVYAICQENWNKACDDLNRVLALAHRTLGTMRENIKYTDNMVANMF